MGAPLGDLVERLPRAEVAGGGDAGLLQQLDGAVDGREADARVLAPGRRQQILERDVARRAQERVDDRLALLRGLEPLALEVRAPVPFRVLARAIRPPRALNRSCDRHLIEHPIDGRCSGRRLSARRQRLERRGELAARDLALVLPRVVDAPAVGEPALAVVDEDVRRAHRAERARHVLRLVVQVREAVALLAPARGQLVERVVGILGGVVRADGDELDAARLELPREPNDPVLHRLDVGAVVADEHHDQHGLAAAKSSRA